MEDRAITAPILETTLDFDAAQPHMERQQQTSTDHWKRNGISLEELNDIEEAARSRGEVRVEKEGRGTWCGCCDLKTLWLYTGPGWLMSIAYLDPGNLEADLQAGAFAGYQLLWMLFWSTCAGLLLQVLAARLGVVTGKNLAEMCRLEYSRPVSIVLWLMTELAIIGSDIQEVVGSAIAFKLLFGLPLWAGCIITGFDTFTLFFIHWLGQRKFEAFFAFLIFTMLVCFFVNFSIASPRWLGSTLSDNGGGILFGTAVPSADDFAVVQAVGILGAVIMPHNIYLHSALVQSRKIDRTDKQIVAEACKYNAIESAVALGVSFIINGAVVAVFAHGFFNKVKCARPGWDMPSSSSSGFNSNPQLDLNLGCFPGDTSKTACPYFRTNATGPFDRLAKCTTATGLAGYCCDIGLATAGDALEGLLGNSASTIWAIGVLAAGQASTMTGTFAGQFVMEGFLNWKVAPWVRTLITRSIALGPAIFVGSITSSSSSAGDKLNQWLNILQSVQLPFALLPVLHFTSSKRIMGKFVNRGWVQVLTWGLASLVVGVNVYLVQEFVTDPESASPHVWWFFALCLILGLLYFFMMGIVIREDLVELKRYLIGFWGSRDAVPATSSPNTRLLYSPPERTSN